MSYGGQFWADFDNNIRYEVRQLRVTSRPRATRRHTKLLRKRQIYRYGCRFWGYLGRWFGSAISLRTSASPAGQESPANRRNTKFIENNRYTVMGVNFN